MRSGPLTRSSPPSCFLPDFPSFRFLYHARCESSVGLASRSLFLIPPFSLLTTGSPSCSPLGPFVTPTLCGLNYPRNPEHAFGPSQWLRNLSFGLCVEVRPGAIVSSLTSSRLKHRNDHLNPPQTLCSTTSEILGLFRCASFGWSLCRFTPLTRVFFVPPVSATIMSRYYS